MKAVKRDEDKPVGATGRAPCGHPGEVAIGNFVSCKICTERERSASDSPPRTDDIKTQCMHVRWHSMQGKWWCVGCGAMQGEVGRTPREQQFCVHASYTVNGSGTAVCGDCGHYWLYGMAP